MTSDHRHRWRASRQLVLVLAVLAIWSSVLSGGIVAAAATGNSAGSCDGVKCPTTDCRKGGFVDANHPCCGDKPICDCFDAKTRSFYPLSMEWLSSDCSQKCICSAKLHHKSFRRVLYNKCRQLRCPSAKEGCKSGYDRCCSICKTASKPTNCHSPELGREFKNGETWRVTSCRHCSCLSGRSVCTDVECPHLSCPAASKPKTLPNECCPSYCRDTNETVRPHTSCPLHGVNRTFPHGRSHRPRWPCSPYKCICRHGGWECDPASASCPTSCLNNHSVQFGSAGQCCPVCAGVKSCLVEHGRVRLAGEMWLDRSKRRQCACIHGFMECFSLTSVEWTTTTVKPPRENTDTQSAWTILLVVVAVLLSLVILGILAYLIKRRNTRAWRLIHFHLGWTRPHRSDRANGTNGKGPPTSIYYQKHGDDETMIVEQTDENANIKTEPLIA